MKNEYSELESELISYKSRHSADNYGSSKINEYIADNTKLLDLIDVLRSESMSFHP